MTHAPAGGPRVRDAFGSTPVPDQPPARRRAAALIPALIALVLMRARFIGTPISTDEGGYLAVARAWRRGAVLYRDVWVDRPQGLLVLFRGLDTIGLGSPTGVRWLALGAGVVAVTASGSIAATLAGERARGISAFVVAVLVSGPRYEAFTANAELLSGAVGAVSLAWALRSSWEKLRPDLGGLAVAGVLGGCALSIKQSGFDAFAAGAVVVAMATWHGGWNRRDRRLALPALFAGLALPLGALALHGAFTGWHRWWYAVAAYRLEQRSAFLNADWGRLGTTFRVVAPVLVPALVIVVVLAAGTSGRRVLPGRATVVLLLWAAFAALAFGLGGQFHLHYWTILMFPVGTLAGTLLASVTSRAGRVVAAAVLLIGPTVQTGGSWTIDRREIGARLHHDGRLDADEHLADWFRVRAGPDDRLYAMCASAGLYGNISADPPYPYLWLDGVDRIPGAHTLLARLLEGPDAPRFVAAFQPASRCDPSGRVGAALGTRYRVAAVVDGIRVFERVGAASPIPDGDR